jgi:hypothetical protein
MKRATAFALILLGAWALIAPQASLGLDQLRWMSHHVFPGEALAGILFLGVAYYLLGAVPQREN